MSDPDLSNDDPTPAKPHQSHSGQCHSHGNSALNEWTASMCEEAILDAWDFGNGEEMDVLDYACGT